MKTALIVLSLISLPYLNSSFTTIKEVTPELPTAPAESELEWHTNLEEVMKLSNETGKPIFAFFTGSDWCGWCKRLHREVFVKDDFKKWANEKVILLELDFPRRKQLPDNIKQQNAGLAQAFKVRGYPTIWIFHADKNEETNNVNVRALGSLGYPRGAVAGKEELKFIDNANKVLAKAQ